jgi:hypothetical protein
MSARRVKFTAKKRLAYLEALRGGARRCAAAESVGIHRETVRKVNRDDPEFAAAVDQAEMDANELVEDALYQASLAGNVVACQVWLYNRQPDRWRDQRNVKAEITGEGGGPLTIREIIMHLPAIEGAGGE